MNKLIRLSPTGIEYGDYAWNFASGCGNNIDGKCKSGGFRCWAYSITQRFEDHYPNGFRPTIYPEALCSPVHLKKPSRILCSFMGDLFWDCPEFDPNRKIHATMPSGKASVSMSLKGWIFTTIRQCPQHSFLFLTKNPSRLINWGKFPDNCWVGVSTTDWMKFSDALGHLATVEAKVKYLSFEPLLGEIKLDMLQQMLFPQVIDGVIVGSLTLSLEDYKNSNYSIRRGLTLKRYGNKWTVQPDIEWVKGIVEACDKAGVAVFLKDNLKPLLNTLDITDTSFGRLTSLDESINRQGCRKREWYQLRQEMPTMDEALGGKG